MPNRTLPSRPQITRSQLAAVFKDPQLVLAIEQLLQTVGTPGSGTVNATGEIVAFAGSIAPSGWLICDGSAVGIVTYPNLYAVIGTIWGAGDGATTFNIPDGRNRSLIGASPTIALGSTGGSATSVLTVANLPAHTHGVTDPDHTHGVTDPDHTHTAQVSGTANLGLDSGIAGTTAVPGNTGSSPTGVTINSAPTGITIQNTGDGDPIETMSPYAAINWLIKT